MRAETLTAAAVSTSTLTALKALRTGRPCSAIRWRSVGSPTASHSVYDARSLGMGFVMFARGSTPVVVGLTAPAQSIVDDAVDAACDAAILIGSESVSHDCVAAPAGNVKPPSDVGTERPMARMRGAAAAADMQYILERSSGAAAAADMLFLHAATTEGPLAPYALTLKTACYERHAASLAVAPRALLAALRDESSPGVFALAAELAFDDDHSIVKLTGDEE